MPVLNRIIVVGASTGGVGALCSLVQGIPERLPAAILIVQHMGRTSVLAEVLRRCQPRAEFVLPKDGEPIRAGRIYVAVPDYHLVVDDGHIRLKKGPRENLHRPSVDVLFRSAARSYGPRVVGVILTGALDDGASGMFAIKSKGGIAIVNDPKDALVADMPESAMKAVEADHCVPLDRIARLLAQLSREPVKEPNAVRKRSVRSEDDLPIADDIHPGFVCPECHGPLVQNEQGSLLHFKCKIGHRYSLDALSEAHAETLERGIWIAVRILEDRAVIQRLRARKLQENNQPQSAAPLLEIARQAELDAKMLREIAQRM